MTHANLYSMKKKIVCKVCGKMFTSFNPNPQFCSNACKSKWQSAGIDFQEPKQPGRRADSPEEGAWMDDRTLRPRGHEDFADAYYARLSAALQSGGYDEKERNDARRSAGMLAHDAWTQGTWWDNFPTVSPVHRGNDGIPIRLDHLSISFGKWRTESLKAYGNAICVQVAYRIFQAIEEASR